MEAKINIAEILKDKPQGTKLYDWLHNIDVELDTISTTDTETVVWCTNETDNNTTCHRGYSEFGTERGCPHGLQFLFPSKSMRDWRKFSWKKGDVLVTEDGSTKVIFECFEDDTYLTFKGKYCLQKTNIDETFIVDTKENLTECFSLQAKNIAQIYIHNIEDRIGGMLNMETLEIEKNQPEFKDGDIVYMGNAWNEYIGIIKNRTSGNQIETYAHCHKDSKEEAVLGLWLNKNDSDELRLATNSEKQQLFEALAKEGKAWDAEKKLIVDLKPKVEFKPFDKVLCRNSKDDTWEADFFARLTRKEIDYTQSGKYLCVGDLWMYCIPYNEETAKLIGTTK